MIIASFKTLGFSRQMLFAPSEVPDRNVSLAVLVAICAVIGGSASSVAMVRAKGGW